MNTTRVSISAARKLGKLLTAMLLLLTACMPNQGAETTITVTGTLNGGHDYLGIFGLGPNMHAGTPYTLVFTIDDTKGGEMRQACPLAGTGISGFGQNNPVTGILTINGKSYEFGRRPDVRSKAWRNVASVCSDSEIGIRITEGRFPLEMGVSIRISPNMGTRSLTQEKDWRKPISLTNVYARNTYNEFGITRQGNNMGGTQSYLSVSSVTVGRK
jgi:hypothetical protein